MFPGPRCSHHAHKEYVAAEAKFANAVTLDDKLVYGEKFEEKQALYDSTPRGQNDLRRAADLAESEEDKQVLLDRLKKGEKLRKQQLDDYYYAIQNRNTDFDDLMKDQKGYKKGKYQDANGMVLMYLTHRFEDKEFHVESLTTISVDDKKILVVPEKYNQKWFEYTYDGETYDSYEHKLTHILNLGRNLKNPAPDTSKLMFEWFASKLKSEDYVAVAAVNRLTREVALVNPDDVHKLFNIGFKGVKRISGTTNYRGTLEELEEALKGTVFEEGDIVVSDKAKKTAIYGIAPQHRSVCAINEKIFLSYRKMEGTNEGYFEARSRHVSKNYDLSVTLEAKQQIVFNGISSKVEL